MNDLREQKQEMNKAILDTLNQTVQELSKATRSEQERISIIAFAHIWKTQVTLYFDHLFYSGLPVLDMDPKDIELYLLAENKGMAYTLIGLGRLESFFKAQLDMLNAFKNCLSYLTARCSYEHFAFQETLAMEMGVFINSTFDQYIKSFHLVSQSRDLLDKYANREERPSIQDMRFKVISDGKDEFQLIGVMPSYGKKQKETEEDPIEVVSSSNAVTASADTTPTEDEDDWQ